MITLITGVPGTGKTAYAVKELLKLKGERPVFSNINGLKIDHFPIDHEWVQTWHEQAPQEALIVIDEAQHSFRPRPQGSKVPDNVAAFETHRHLGVDFILITQRPTLIDANIRGLAGRYLHVRETAISRMVHEASEVVDFSQKSVREENAKSAYKIPREVFGLYKSSQLHTKKPRRRLPTAAYMLLALVPLIGILGWNLYGAVGEKLAPAPLSARPAGGAPGGGLPTPSALPAGAVDHGQRLRLATLPLDPDDPLSAPLYADKKPPVVVPVVAVCISSASRCSCYSQQQTPIWLPEDQCRQRAAGTYYDPYRQPPEPRRLASPSLPPGGQNNRPESSADSLLPPEGRAPTADGSPDVIASPA